VKLLSTLALPLLLAITTTACSKDGAAGPGNQALAKTRVEKVTMNGVSWEVALPVDMKAPSYKVTSPEYLGDNDMKLGLDSTFPKFPTVEGYLERNAATKVLEKKQVGPAYFIVLEKQSKTDTNFSMTAMVPNQTIGWRCSGAAAREADVRAMCASVKFSKP
jgi:hypothetical protein